MEILSDKNLDSLLVQVLGNLLRHKMMLNLALKEVSDEGLDIVNNYSFGVF